MPMSDPVHVTDTGEVAIIADSHDRQELVTEQAQWLVDNEIDHLIHLGDVREAITMRQFALTGVEIHAVFGNGEIEKDELAGIVDATGGTHHGESAALRIGERTFYIHHGVDHGKSYGIARGHTDIDYVLHGHWHNHEHNVYDNGEVLNPGSEGIYCYDPYGDTFAHISSEADKPHASDR